VDLPGVAREDLSIEWSGRDLTVRGEVKERERTGMLRRQTRRAGTFHYGMTLPGEIDGDNITADLRDGVLTIHAPKSQTAKPRRIELVS
jgi:HSP20 family protein